MLVAVLSAFFIFLILVPEAGIIIFLFITWNSKRQKRSLVCSMIRQGFVAVHRAEGEHYRAGGQPERGVENTTGEGRECWSVERCMSTGV